MIITGVADTVVSGSLLAALALAFAAGAVSFASPCVLPLAPAYLSYVTGLTGAEIAAGQRRSRVLLGSVLFVLGFSVLFVSYGLLFGGLGSFFLQWQDVLTRILGVVVIIMGLVFMGIGSWTDRFQREARIHVKPTMGLWGAPLLGFLFGLGWTPCIGPTLAAVQGLAFTEASAGRGALLSFAYCLGLGLPFIALGLLFRWAAGTLTWLRQHYVLISRIGGGLLIVLGVLMVTGVWTTVSIWLRTLVPGFEVPL